MIARDIDAAKSGKGLKAAPAAAPAAAAPVIAPALGDEKIRALYPDGSYEVVPHDNMRKVIAQRLTQSTQTVPHFYVSMDIEIDALLKLRSQLNATSPKDGPGAFKLSVNDLVIKAAAVTLRRFPDVNATWTDDAIIQYHDVDISVAVSIPDGLITPIVRRADQKGLAAISNEMKDLAARAKAGKLKPEEFQGGGFSISNMGMYGVEEFTAILNPPEAGILAVGTASPEAVVRDGEIVIRSMMRLTLSADHRVLDGATAAVFLGRVKTLLEHPAGALA